MASIANIVRPWRVVNSDCAFVTTVFLILASLPLALSWKAIS